MASIVRDTFTEAVDTNLTAHTPEVGGAWTAATTFTVIGATDIVKINSGQEFFWNAAVPPSADYRASVTGRTVATGSTDRFGVAFRGDGGNFATAGTDTYYTYIRGDGVMQLFKQVNGAITTLGTDYTIPGFSASTDYKCEGGAVGTSITAYLDNVSVITATDSAHSGAGQLGGYERNNSAYITLYDSDDLQVAGQGYLLGQLRNRLVRAA